MKDIQEFLIFVGSFCTQDGDQYSQLPDVIKLLKNTNNHTVSSVESLGLLLSSILKKAILTRRVTVFPGNKPKIEFDEGLMKFLEEALEILRNIVSKNNNKEIQVTSLKALLFVLIIQSKFDEKSRFPVKEFAMNLACIVSAEHNVNSLLSILEPNMCFQDVSASLWESLQRIMTLDTMRPLKPNHVKNILSIISLNKTKTDELTKTLSGQLSKFDEKKIGIVVKVVWEQLARVELQDDVQQKLSLTLIEHIMPLIDKPVTLTDYFMVCLNRGGPNALVALQGIFNLIQKYNINYPNVYNKLYTMFEPAIFDTPYKARFYYLSDIFLSSLCLPLGMVAAFIKRFSRMSLVAPPEDIVILLAFITNLLIRHPSLKYLVNCPSYQTVESDPYDFEEKDPVKSRASESSLWEVKLLQEHVLPNVSSAAMFVNIPLPSAERDLANLLENSSTLIFARECKKKLKETPVNYEKPFSIRNQSRPTSFNFWALT